MHTTKTAVMVRCMDKRHWGKIAEAVARTIGDDYKVYDLTEPGGAGLFASLAAEPQTSWLSKKVDVAMGLGATEVWLAVHGSCDQDGNGCGGYKLGGFEDRYSTPEASRQFSHGELKAAADCARKRFPKAERVRAFYVTFGKNGENNVEEVL